MKSNNNPINRITALIIFFACLVLVNFCNICIATQQTLTDEVKAQELKYPSSVAKPAPCVSWSDPLIQPRFVLLCIHGLGLHKGTFEPLGKELANKGAITYAIDMRGFGESIETKRRAALDFDGCLVDIKAALEQIHKEHRNLPVVILGESMGGAIALRAAALYPDLISGLISCVPARDRFSLGESAMKVGVHAITSGFSTPIENVGEVVVKRATSKTELQKRLKENPMVRMSFSPNELMQFDEFMSKNLEYAKQITSMPTLFIMGAKDKLIKPAGTWKVFEHIASPKRQLVLSGNSEHLIFEEGQYNPEDISFVIKWIGNNVISTSTPTSIPTSIPTATRVPTTSPETAPPHIRHDVEVTASINYWIEMFRNGKTYRCNNKLDFKTGDIIRFHVIPETDGFAYLIMRAGSTGKSKILFPTAESGMNNFLQRGKDYAIPASGWMQFDKNPGTEHLSLVFSKEPINISPEDVQATMVTCYVSPELSGAKDLVPTRMKLTWDNPNPVMIPDDFSGISQIKTDSSSLVRVVSSTPSSAISLDIALMHH